jgi:hypothetical protein
MRTAVPKLIRFRAVGGSTWTVVEGRSIGEGSTVEPASPREQMANGASRAAGYRYNINITIKTPQKVAAFTEAYVGTAGEGESPPAGSWASLGAMESDGGSITYNSEAGEDSARLMLFRSMQVQTIFELLDVTKYAVLSPMNETEVAIAFRRIDGTFKVFPNVLLSAEINPAWGTGRMQTVRVQLESTAVRNILDVSEGISSTHFAALNTIQRNGQYLEMEVEYSDNSKIILPRVGFVATPMEPFGEEALEGITIEGSAYGPTPGSVFTVSPALT